MRVLRRLAEGYPNSHTATVEPALEWALPKTGQHESRNLTSGIASVLRLYLELRRYKAPIVNTNLVIAPTASPLTAYFRVAWAVARFGIVIAPSLYRRQAS